MNPQPTSSRPQKLRLTAGQIVLLSVFLIVCGVGFASSSSQPLQENSDNSATQERKLKLKAFKDIPVAIHKVINLQSETWHKDLGIEVKNISDKRIYFMLVYLIFPDESVPGGESGIPLAYGDPEKNGRIDIFADPQDEHLEPGETYVLTIEEQYKKGLKAKHEKFPHVTKNLILKVSIVNFGDGTGFEGGRSLDLRGKGNAPPPLPGQVKKISWKASYSTATPVQSDCGSGNCFRWFVNPVPVASSCYGCLTLVATISPTEPCRRAINRYFDCDADGVPECYNQAIDDAGSASCPGAPTPGPTEEPTPSENCPQIPPSSCPSGVAVDTCAYTDLTDYCPNGYQRNRPQPLATGFWRSVNTINQQRVAIMTA